MTVSIKYSILSMDHMLAGCHVLTLKDNSVTKGHVGWVVFSWSLVTSFANSTWMTYLAS